MKKNGRLNIRIEERDKAKFYEICDQNGICPSQLIAIWIKRFNHASKKKLKFSEIYSAQLEKLIELERYRNL